MTAAADDASLRSFHIGLGVAAALVAAGGLAGAAGIRNPKRLVRAETCPGGPLVGASPEAVQPTGSRA